MGFVFCEVGWGEEIGTDEFGDRILQKSLSETRRFKVLLVVFHIFCFFSAPR